MTQAAWNVCCCLKGVSRFWKPVSFSRALKALKSIRNVTRNKKRSSFIWKYFYLWSHHINHDCGFLTEHISVLFVSCWLCLIWSNGFDVSLDMMTLDTLPQCIISTVYLYLRFWTDSGLAGYKSNVYKIILLAEDPVLFLQGMFSMVINKSDKCRLQILGTQTTTSFIWYSITNRFGKSLRQFVV